MDGRSLSCSRCLAVVLRFLSWSWARLVARGLICIARFFMFWAGAGGLHGWDWFRAVEKGRLGGKKAVLGDV